MCTFCDRPCWRSGGEYDCDLTDAEFNEAMDALDDGWYSYREPEAEIEQTSLTPAQQVHGDSR